jgi:ergothioneine biosynthesis protein EgtB
MNDGGDAKGTEGLNSRHAGREWLARALAASRRDTLAMFDLYAARGLDLPPSPELNPPLWELGHIGWFQEFWVGRNPQRRLGTAADPLAPRMPGVRSDADALYDSSRVAHGSRWHLPLPDAAATRADLAAQLAQTLALLAGTEESDTGFYFHRLALLHEDMHHEAALYMAQTLGIAVADPRWQPQPLTAPREELLFDAGRWRLGHEGGGFAFDNELGAHDQELAATRIDSRVLCWADYLPFIEAGGGPVPRKLQRVAGGWQQQVWGRWQPLDLRLPTCHLSCFEAEAWCAAAGRRLPTEAEWERAACLRPQAFEWGAVWEWTASRFEPYPGFVAHPYRDYSAPWFGSRRVLRGASVATAPRMRHPRYRNFFPPGRNDIHAGFRTCAV